MEPNSLGICDSEKESGWGSSWPARAPKCLQIIDFDKFISTWDKDQNLVFVTHYVVISEILNYAPSSGEIVISDKCIVELLPRTDSIRRLQHEIIQHYHLNSRIVEEGSKKRIRIYPY